MESQAFQSIATVQALSSLKRWTKGGNAGRASSLLSTQLWNPRAVAGTVAKYAAETAMLKAERWAKLSSVEERARYISRALGHRKQPRVTVSMPKLCPRGGGSIEVLNDVQAVAPRLMTPGGPIRRLILQIPPGAGKTCTYLGVMAQFIGNGHTIVVVGDDDVFAVFKEGLRQCPAVVYRRMVGPDGKTLAPQETVYLRDINPHMSAFCTVKSLGTNPNLQGYPINSNKCDPSAFSWLDTRVYFFNFVMAGNWMQAWSEQRTNAKGGPVTSMYHEVSPFSNKLLLVVDEAHKLGVPSMEQTTERWKAAAALFPKYIASLGKDKGTNPYILVGTATVNTTPMPTLSLCLPRVIKGFTDPTLFVDDDVTKPPRLNLHEYLSPAAGFVRTADKVVLKGVPPQGGEPESVAVSVKQLKERLVKFRGFTIDEPLAKKGAAAAPPAEDLDHPCPVSTRALRDAGYSVYEPIDTEENRKRLLDIWAGVVYIVDMSQDFRYYPTTNHPYPAIRPVELPAESPQVSREDYLKLLEKPKGMARWTEVSQFADQTLLMSTVQSCLSGEPLDLLLVESLAPKWKAVADDLITDTRLRGRTMVYPGAYNRKGCDDNYYLLLLAFYLQAKLRPFVQKHCPGGVKEHQLITLESVLHADREEARTAAPAIYIVGDSTEGKHLAGEIDAHLKAGAGAVEAGRVPRAEDLVSMLSTREFRERQYNRYNDEVCPGPAFVPQQAAGNTIIILGEGGHKALDLKCTSNGCILSTMPGGKFQQTQGRVKRSCAFKKLMDATALWTVNVRMYLLWDSGGLAQGPVIDQALHSFYEAQYQIIRYLEMIEAMAGVGCSNWEVYSNWKKTFSDFDGYPQGGFKCVHDANPGELRAANQSLWEFYRCGGGGAEAQTIERGVSGDVSPEYVEKSTHGTCTVAPAAVLQAQTAREALRAASRAFHAPAVLFAEKRKREERRFKLKDLPAEHEKETAPLSRGRSVSESSEHGERSGTGPGRSRSRTVSSAVDRGEVAEGHAEEGGRGARSARPAQARSRTQTAEMEGRARSRTASVRPADALKAALPLGPKAALQEMRRRTRAGVERAGAMWNFPQHPRAGGA